MSLEAQQIAQCELSYCEGAYCVLMCFTGFSWAAIHIIIAVVANKFLLERIEKLRAVGLLPPADADAPQMNTRMRRSNSGLAEEMIPSTPKLSTSTTTTPRTSESGPSSSKSVEVPTPSPSSTKDNGDAKTPRSARHQRSNSLHRSTKTNYVKVYRDSVVQFYGIIIALCLISAILLTQASLFWTLHFKVRVSCAFNYWNVIYEGPIAVLSFAIGASLLLTLLSLTDIANNTTTDGKTRRKVVAALSVAIPTIAGTICVLTGKRIAMQYIDVGLSMIYSIAAAVVGVYVSSHIGHFATATSLTKVRLVSLTLCFCYALRALYEIPYAEDTGIEEPGEVRIDIPLGGDSVLAVNYGSVQTPQALFVQIVINFIPIVASMIVLRTQRES